MPNSHDSAIPATKRDDQDGLKTGESPTTSHEFAKHLHEKAYIYALYGALDGLSLSYSMVKYGFDLLCTNKRASSSDMMHEWMMTPAGMAAAAAESITIIGFSLLASVFKDDDKTAFKRYIAILWPYCRDTMKGLKNAYKGVRATMQVTSVFAGQDLRYMILPVGIVLGVLSVANRIYYRRMVEQRKTMMLDDANLLREIKNNKVISAEDKARYLDVIEKQREFLTSVQYKAMLSQVYSGVVDGLYLYMGAMGLTALAPPVFIAMAILCTVFTLTCIATRVYEEYDYQRKLRISQAKIEFAICGKELYELFTQVDELSESILAQLNTKMAEFKDKKEILRQQLTLSYTSAMLAGMKNGLAAYGAITSIMFAVATVNAMLLAPFPPAFLIMAVLAGVACLLGFTAHSLLQNYLHLSTQQEKIDKPIKNLNDLLIDLKSKKELARNDVFKLEPSAYKDAIRGDICLDPSPQFFFQEWFEVARSFFSGLAKGQKSVDYTLNSLQEIDEQGHYYDTPVMLGLTVLSSFVYTFGFALRAYTRGFGRNPVEEPIGDLGLETDPPAANRVKEQKNTGSPTPPEDRGSVLRHQANSHQSPPTAPSPMPSRTTSPSPQSPSVVGWMRHTFWPAPAPSLNDSLAAPLPSSSTSHIAPGLK